MGSRKVPSGRKGASWQGPLLLWAVLLSSQSRHNRYAQQERIGWDDTNTLGWILDQKRKGRGTTGHISVRSGEELRVYMDVNVLVLLTVCG